MNNGQKVKDVLGINKFKYSYIQRSINHSLPIYLVTVDSKYPSRPITYQKIRNSKSTLIDRIKNKENMIYFNNLKWTPPVELQSFTGIIDPNALLIRQDLALDTFQNKTMFEDIKMKGGYLIID